MNKKLLVILFLFVCISLGHSTWATSMYVAGVWNTDTIHILDQNFNSTFSFAAGSTAPNGVTSDSNYIYSGHPFSNQVFAYDYSGVQQFSWSGVSGGLQGMAMVGSELAIFDAFSNDILFYNPLNGSLIRSINSVPLVEGLAYDGSLLWQIETSALIGVNPLTGAVISTIPNAAGGAQYGGTGIAYAGSGLLALATTSGN